MGDIARPTNDDVVHELARQRVDEGWTAEHDQQHANGELARAALAYLTRDEAWWPWSNTPKFGPRDLIKAGALLLAEDKRREIAQRRNADNAVLRWFHAEAAFERDQLQATVDALRDAHHIPYVDEEHQGGNCADIVMALTARAFKAESELDRLHSWQGLLSLLDEHYPAEVFTGEGGDEGPRVVALIREVDRLQHEIMGYQAPGGEYDRGYEHGSAVAAQYRDERDRERASRQDWAAEATRLSWIHEFHGASCLSDEIHPRVCACISDEQAAQLDPRFTRPVCAVHEQKDASDA